MADEIPRTVEQIYADFAGRRDGLIKALTTEFQEFFNQCDPDKEKLLCLYGDPNGNWEVRLPEERVPTAIPEPTFGINFDRDEVLLKDWRSLVAVYSDSWLFFVAFWFAGKLYFQKSQREQLFRLMNGLPTVSEAVSEFYKTTFVSETGSSSNSAKYSAPMLASEEGGGLEEKEDEEVCGACGEHADGFWIQCDACNKWFHGKCVKITRAKAKLIDHYNCPTCDLETSKQRAHG